MLLHNCYSKKKKILIGFTSFSLMIFMYEWYSYRRSKKKIRSQILKLICQSKSNEFEFFYSFDLNKIRDEMIGYNQEEKKHSIDSINRSFDVNNLDYFPCGFKKITSFHNFRSLRNPDLFDFCIHNIGANQYISCIDNMLYLPSIFRFIISGLNIFSFLKFKINYDTYLVNNTNLKILIINHQQKESLENKKKILIIFLGLGGILDSFSKIINFFAEKGYIILIPIYRPAHADWFIDNSIHEAQFYKYLIEFMNMKKIKKIEILAWSMGGIIYKGFEKYILLKDMKIRIERVILLEPLITSRAAIDTYFSQIRSFRSTLNIFNNFTKDKYKCLNFAFSYILHTEIGFFSSNSIGYFSSVELRNGFKCNYPRYIFISECDIVFNSIKDEQILSSNFDKEKIFMDEGYHGSWLYRNKSLIPRLKEIVK